MHPGPPVKGGWQLVLIEIRINQALLFLLENETKKIMKRLFYNNYFLITSEDGATSVEYVIIASLIAAIIAVAVGVLGSNVLNLFNTVHF